LEKKNDDSSRDDKEKDRAREKADETEERPARALRHRRGFSGFSFSLSVCLSGVASLSSEDLATDLKSGGPSRIVVEPTPPVASPRLSRQHPISRSSDSHLFPDREKEKEREREKEKEKECDKDRRERRKDHRDKRLSRTEMSKSPPISSLTLPPPQRHEERDVEREKERGRDRERHVRHQVCDLACMLTLIKIPLSSNSYWR
jgi:hypothetical protein